LDLISYDRAFQVACCKSGAPSNPRNPLISEALLLAGYIEKAGAGTVDMFAQCRDAGLHCGARAEPVRCKGWMSSPRRDG